MYQAAGSRWGHHAQLTSHTACCKTYFGFVLFCTSDEHQQIIPCWIADPRFCSNAGLALLPLPKFDKGPEMIEEQIEGYCTDVRGHGMVPC